MEETVSDFEVGDGLRLRLYRWLPGGGEELRGVVQIAHGMGEHAGRYEPVAAALCAEGFAVYANDHRGHGGTAADEQSLGDMGPDGWNRCVIDLNEVGNAISQRHPGVPRILLGHSMGSFLTQQYLTQYGDGLDAVVLSGSSGGRSRVALAIMRCVARFERKRLGPAGASPLLGGAMFGSFNRKLDQPRTDFDWLSRDPEQVDKYIDDPWCGFMLRTQSLMDMWDGMEAAQLPEELTRIPKNLPMYIFSGDQDPVHNQLKGYKALLDRYRGLDLTSVADRLYPGGRHEMFNETNRTEVIDDLIAWLKSVIKPSAGEAGRPDAS